MTGYVGVLEWEKVKTEASYTIEPLLANMGGGTLLEKGEETLYRVKIGVLQRVEGQPMKWITALLELMKGGWKYLIGERRKQM